MKTQSGTFHPEKHTQQTLQQALEWSFQSLSETDIVVLQQLSCLPKRFTTEIAENIVAVDSIYSVSDLLDNLTNCNLIHKSFPTRITPLQC